MLKTFFGGFFSGLLLIFALVTVLIFTGLILISVFDPHGFIIGFIALCLVLFFIVSIGILKSVAHLMGSVMSLIFLIAILPMF